MQHFHLAHTHHWCRAGALVSGGETLAIALSTHPSWLEAAEIIRDKSRTPLLEGCLPERNTLIRGGVSISRGTAEGARGPAHAALHPSVHSLALPRLTETPQILLLLPEHSITGRSRRGQSSPALGRSGMPTAQSKQGKLHVLDRLSKTLELSDAFGSRLPCDTNPPHLAPAQPLCSLRAPAHCAHPLCPHPPPTGSRTPGHTADAAKTSLLHTTRRATPFKTEEKYHFPHFTAQKNKPPIRETTCLNS